MFNVGGPEIMVVLLVALIVLGPEQLPKAMRTFGNVMAQVRKVSSGFQDEMRSAMNTLDVTSTVKEANPFNQTSSPRSESGPASSSTTGSPSSGPVASEGGVTEVAARNDAPVVDPVTNRPGTSSADRAAG